MNVRTWAILAAAAGTAIGWGQKKPVTLEAAAQIHPRLPEIVASDWSPDGTRFLYSEGRRLRMYDCSTQRSSILVAVGELEAKAKGTAGSTAFE